MRNTERQTKFSTEVYEAPAVEIVCFDANDVIATSNLGEWVPAEGEEEEE